MFKSKKIKEFCEIISIFCVMFDTIFFIFKIFINLNIKYSLISLFLKYLFEIDLKLYKYYIIYL
jgi:hypothetical protein